MIRALQVVGGLVGLWILGTNFRDAWHELSTQPLRISWAQATLATVVLAATYAGFAALWRTISAELGTKIPYGTCIQFWSFSNLGRYVPGKIWQITGVMLVASELGVPPAIAAATGVLALGFMVATGSLVGFVLLPSVLASDPMRIALAAVSVVMLIVPIARPDWVANGIQLLPRKFRPAGLRAPSRGGIVRITMWFLLAWIIHGAVFQLFCGALVPVSLRDGPGLTGAFCVAYVAGLIAIIAPGGIGVREEILASTLVQVLPGQPVHLIAVAARLWTMAAELIILGVAFVLRVRALRAPR